jgi:uncharacterized membrane protein (DUF106 family)
MTPTVAEHAVLIVITLFLIGTAGLIWLLYLIKLVTNEEELQEKIREVRRRREERARKRADEKRKKVQSERGPSLQDMIQGNVPPPDASGGGGES